MEKRSIFKAVSYIGAAIREGQDLVGVEEAPDALRKAGLFEALRKKFEVEINDYGNISYQSMKQKIDESCAEKYKSHVKNLHILDPMLKQVSERCSKAISDSPQNLVITIGGDHSVATGSIHAQLKRHKNLKVVWVDAHPDFIDASSSHYDGYHGMPLSHLAGVTKLPGFEWLDCQLPCQNIVLIGIRDIDPDQWVSLKKYKIKCFTPDHIDKYGIGRVLQMAIQYLDPENKCPFHISFDIDAMDPHLATGTGTKFRDGLSHRQACHIIRRVAHERNLVALDVVQINPKLEKGINRQQFRGQQHIGDVSQTVGLGIDLIQSCFTKYLTL